MVVAAESVIAAAQRFTEALSWRAQDRAKRPHEIRVARLMRRMFAAQAAAIARDFFPRMKAELVEAEMPSGLSVLLGQLLANDRRRWETALAALLARVFTEAGVSIGRDLNLGPDFQLPTDRVEQIMQDRAGDRITRIDETTRDAVRQILTDGIAQRKSYQQVARELRAKFREFSTPARQRHIRDRAELIAITEVGQAYVDGQLDVARQLQLRGLVMEKSWLTVGDSRVSDGCAANGAAGWIPLDTAFPSGHPSPLRFPGCRCALQMRRESA